MTAPAAARAQSGTILLRPEYAPGRQWPIVDSRWGFVARFNVALADRLDACGKEDEMRQAALIRLALHRFGGVAEKGLELLATCDPKHMRDWRAGGPVTITLWGAIASEAGLPTVLKRTRAIAFRGAGLAADYDIAFWSADAPREADEPLGEVFIWGPSRASVASGCYVQRIVREIAARPGEVAMLVAVFADVPEGLEAMRMRSCAASDDCHPRASRMPRMRQ